MQKKRNVRVFLNIGVQENPYPEHFDVQTVVNFDPYANVRATTNILGFSEEN